MFFELFHRAREELKSFNFNELDCEESLFDKRFSICFLVFDVFGREAKYFYFY